MKILFLFKSIVDCLFGFLLSKLRPVNDHYYLIGSNYGGQYDPNAQVLFNYLIEKNQTVIMVVGSQTELTGNTVRRGSLKAAYYFFISHACFYTHSLSDVMPHAHKLFWLKKVLGFPQLIFLQHGVIGLKSMLSNGVLMKSYIQSLEPTFDKMIVSSSVEASIIERFGIPSQKLAITGLPRFDSYHKETTVEKMLLVFFTWQNASSLDAKHSQIEHSGILDRLNAEDYKVVTVSHDMQEGSRQEAISTVEFQHAITTCSLLITDDSSLAWDIFYRKQQVIFLSPSKDWLTDEPELLQRRCFTEEELREKVDKFISGRNMPEPLQFADYYDNKNCERVVALCHQNG